MKEDKRVEEMIEKKPKTLVISITAIIISLIALTFSVCLKWSISASFLVGLLGVMVTILLGWQILNIVDLENRVKSIVIKTIYSDPTLKEIIENKIRQNENLSSQINKGIQKAEDFDKNKDKEGENG